jgi:hypothetical protein
MIQHKDCILYRIAPGDDGDTEEFTVSVEYEMHPPEPDVGIMSAWPEVHGVYCGKLQYYLTGEQYDDIVEQLRAE